MRISKNYQKALEIIDLYKEFELLKYEGGKTPKITLKCLNCGKENTRQTHHFIQYPHNCPSCHPKGTSQKITLEECQKRIDSAFGENVLTIVKYNGNNTTSVFKCNKCNYIFEAVPTSIWRKRTLGCPQCTQSKSSGENLIEAFLRKNNIHFRKQERFANCKDKQMLPFDFYLPDYNTCIEFQGEQHYKKDSFYWSEKLMEHDEIKRNFCKKHNIKLIEIPYWEKNNISNILGSFKK